MKESNRLLSGGIRKRTFFKCRSKNCNGTRSVRAINSFSFYTSESTETRSKLSLKKILELVFFFLHIPVTLDAVSFLVGVGKCTVVDWFHSSIMPIAKSMDNGAQFVGTESCPVQVHESKIAGTAKFRKGRRLQGD